MNEYQDVNFTCPQCAKPIVIDAKGKGFIITCPDCQAQLIVPDQSGGQASVYVKPVKQESTTEGRGFSPEIAGDLEFQDTAGGSGIRENEKKVTALIAHIFSQYVPNVDLSPEAQYVLTYIKTLYTPHTKQQHLLGAEKRFGPDYRHQHNEEMLDFLLYFIESCLQSHKITKLEIDELLELRVLLDIRDGELYQKRREKIRRLLEMQIDWMEEAYDIDRSEQLYLVDLQRIFDLSYDQLLELSQPHVAEILDNLYLQITIAYRDDIRSQMDQLIRVFYMSNYRPFEHKKEGANEVAGRMIPQSVKDSVWRRDNGRCAVCGSQQNLEFDHIIPFSLGGSNTYRNIQLLCETCNRTKGSRIG